MKDKAKAKDYLKKETRVADELNSRLELLQFYFTNKLNKKALGLGEEILKLDPDTAGVPQVVTQLKAEI
ncbi:hypothetical protein [Mangrovibacterium marinum]|nr:hypothetical protein [Mangrovibacterium marinum]